MKKILEIMGEKILIDSIVDFVKIDTDFDSLDNVVELNVITNSIRKINGEFTEVSETCVFDFLNPENYNNYLPYVMCVGSYEDYVIKCKNKRDAVYLKLMNLLVEPL